MKQIIVAMSGRKQAGKNTLGQFIRRYYVEIANWPPVSQDTLVDEHTMECSFADNLKEFCIDTLGLPYEACYGTEEEKKRPTQYNWEDAPKFLRWKFQDSYAQQAVAQGLSQDDLHEIYGRCINDCAPMHFSNGPMTGRDIMQLCGTDLIRQTFGNVWANATIRRIQKNGKPFSVITDNRFPDEIEAVLAEPHGYIIRLTRSPFGTKDAHPSESALDGFEWNRERCFVLDNAEMTIQEQSEAIKPIMDQILV